MHSVPTPLVQLALGALVAVSTACVPELPPQAPAAPPAAPIAPAKTSSLTPTAPSSEQPSYSGHGAESISPELLAKYAAGRLPEDVSRRIQAMLDVRSPAGGMLSPDGKNLFFSWTITGIRQVWRIDGPQKFPVQLTGGEDPTSIADMTPDGKYLVLSRDRKGEENPGLYLQDPKGGSLVLIQHKPKVQTFHQFITDDSRYLYYRANDIKVDSYAIYRYDITTKQRELVFDQQGIWRAVDFTKDGKLLLAKDVGSQMSEYFEWMPSTKTLTPLFGQGEREDYTAAYGASGEILVLTPKLGEFRRLYRWKESKFDPITPELKMDVDHFSIDRAKRRILYLVNDNGYTRLHAMDAKAFREIKLPQFPTADHIRPIATTRDGKLTTLTVENATMAPTSFVLDWNTGKLTQWHTPSAPEIDIHSFATASLESYPARDGTKIPIFVYRPSTCEKPCPVIILFHGGPEGQALPGFNARAQLFVQAGFILIEPNVRGSDGYGKTWLHADDGKRRLDIITDIDDAAKYARKAFEFNGKPPKVGILGGSYGGYSALIGMTMFAGAYDAGVSVVGISNLYTFLKNTAPYRRILRISEYGDPEKDQDALLKLSPVTYMDRVKSPLLIIQGVTDPRVPAGESIQIQQALEAKKIPSELILFPDEGHGAQKRDNQVLQYGHILRFFQTHLR